MSSKKVYFDNAATTKIHPQVVEKMIPYLTHYYGNPSSIHSFGRKGRIAIEEAREIAAASINAHPSEIYFLSGGTEANNFSVRGIASANKNETGRNKIVSSTAEHHCVLDSCVELEKEGFELIRSSLNKDFSLNYEELNNWIDDKTSVVSIMHVNNEVGSINNIEDIGNYLISENTYFHTDAVQSYCKLSIDIKKLNVHSLSVSSHKINGPKGIGFSYVKSGTPIIPILYGGSQERNRRGGTENVAAIVGFAESIKIASINIESNYKTVEKIREALINGINSIDSDGIKINNSPNQLPHILSITLNPFYYKNDSEAMLMYLDINGIAVSNGAACSSGTLKPSHVILSGGYTKEEAEGTIRFSFSPENTLDEVSYCLEVLARFAKKFKK
jgi:cysteine desulfurase